MDLMLRKIIEGLENTSGQDFFNKIVLNLSKVIKTDYVFIAQVDTNRGVSSTISLSAKGGIADNFEYELQNTPCANVADDSMCCYPKDVTSVFPNDQLLIDMNIEAYLGSPLHDSKGNVLGLIVAMSEKPILDEKSISTLFEIFAGRIAVEMERTEQEHKIEYLAYHDSTTNLYNLTALEEKLLSGKLQTLLLLNINNFSYINFAYGFETGNELLIKIANILKSLFPKEQIYRTHSDEYAILFDGEVDVNSYIESIRNYFYDNKVEIDTIVLHISFTFGASTDNKDIFYQSVFSLKKAKEQGKNSAHIFDKDKDVVDSLQRKEFIKNNNLLYNALENDEIIPFFQGIMNNNSGKIDKYEVLARIKHNNKIITPYEFIEPARLSGLLPEITKVIIDKSFKVMSAHTFSFSINITEDDLNRSYLLPYLNQKSKEYGIEKSRIILEILEGISSSGKENNVKQLMEIKDEGYRLAIDDFGAEYSNFERILELDIDFLKIDAKYIKDIDSNKKSYEVTRAIAYFAKNTGIPAIAEYVHNEHVQKIVKELEICFSQGYYFSEPKETI